MAIPFGRFFNNTIAFMGKNTPGLNMVLRGAGYYDSMPKGEAFSRSLVTAGILYTLSDQEIENVKQGLPVYTAVDPISGQLVDQTFQCQHTEWVLELLSVKSYGRKPTGNVYVWSVQSRLWCLWFIKKLRYSSERYTRGYKNL